MAKISLRIVRKVVFNVVVDAESPEAAEQAYESGHLREEYEQDFEEAYANGDYQEDYVSDAVDLTELLAD